MNCYDGTAPGGIPCMYPFRVLGDFLQLPYVWCCLAVNSANLCERLSGDPGAVHDAADDPRAQKAANPRRIHAPDAAYGGRLQCRQGAGDEAQGASADTWVARGWRKTHIATAVENVQQDPSQTGGLRCVHVFAQLSIVVGTATLAIFICSSWMILRVAMTT